MKPSIISVAYGAGGVREPAVAFRMERHALTQGHEIVWWLGAHQQGEACYEADASGNNDKGQGVSKRAHGGKEQYERTIPSQPSPASFVTNYYKTSQFSKKTPLAERFSFP